MRGTDKIISLLKVNSHGRVLFLSALCTAFTVAASVCAISFVLSSIAPLPGEALITVLAVAALVPMMVTPPLAYIFMSIALHFIGAAANVRPPVRLDALTGLYGRDYFLEKVRQMLDEGGAFLMVEADHFSRISDTHGHALSEAALKRFAQALRAGVKSASLISRLGGGQFGIFIPMGKLHDADTAAIRASAAVCSLCHTISGHEIHMTASIGGAVYEAGMTLEDLTGLASERLRRARNAGRSRAFLADAPPVIPDFSDIEFWDEPATSAAA
jgi:diguanylate cyclase